MRTIELTTDVLIVGGGASGVCAAIQAARQGVAVILVEETMWLGGMLTAAGVSAVDGNHHLPSGLWGEFRQRLYQYYGSPAALATGWVSHTLFEPRVGQAIFEAMVAQEPGLIHYHGFWLETALKIEDRVTGAIFVNDAGDKLRVQAEITIDATECGDLLKAAGSKYDLGRDARHTTGEATAPETADDVIQDLTYVAILKDYRPQTAKILPPPPGYNPLAYRGTCRELAENNATNAVDGETMLNYGRLPNQKLMINWPNQGNDYFLNLIEIPPSERRNAMQTAKDFTLGYIYFLQTEGGFDFLGLAEDEFPTADHLPLIPYHRESRRVCGVVRLTTSDLINPYQSPQGPLYQTGIAVGDYPLDHHHKKAPRPIDETFPAIPAFNIPYGCLVPRTPDGLLVAEKSISVTHLVNGCTRLQPVVMQIGQAAGAAAAWCVQNQCQPRQIDMRALQQQLLDAQCWLMPFGDVPVTNPGFQAIQRVGLCGWLKGELISQSWENKMLFHPERKLTAAEWREFLSHFPHIAGNFDALQNSRDDLEITWRETLPALWAIISGATSSAVISTPDSLPPAAAGGFQSPNWGADVTQFLRRDLARPITRQEFAQLLDLTLKPFERVPIAILPIR